MGGLGLSSWVLAEVGFECYWVLAKYVYGCFEPSKINAQLGTPIWVQSNPTDMPKYYGTMDKP